jgi:hypothetical protein
MIRAKIARLDQADTRLAARRLVNFGVRVGSAEAGGSHDVLVIDLSAVGCRLQSAGGLEAGTALWLKLPDHEARRVHVVWSRGDEAGCEFAAPLYEGELKGTRAVSPRPVAGRRADFGRRV